MDTTFMTPDTIDFMTLLCSLVVIYLDRYLKTPIVRFESLFKEMLKHNKMSLCDPVNRNVEYS